MDGRHPPQSARSRDMAAHYISVQPRQASSAANRPRAIMGGRLVRGTGGLEMAQQLRPRTACGAAGDTGCATQPPKPPWLVLHSDRQRPGSNARSGCDRMYHGGHQSFRSSQKRLTITGALCRLTATFEAGADRSRGSPTSRKACEGRVISLQHAQGALTRPTNFIAAPLTKGGLTLFPMPAIPAATNLNLGRADAWSMSTSCPELTSTAFKRSLGVRASTAQVRARVTDMEQGARRLDDAPVASQAPLRCFAGSRQHKDASDPL